MEAKVYRLFTEMREEVVGRGDLCSTISKFPLQKSSFQFPSKIIKVRIKLEVKY